MYRLEYDDFAIENGSELMKKLLRIGFQMDDIMIYNDAVMIDKRTGRISSNMFRKLGCSENRTRRIMYMRSLLNDGLGSIKTAEEVAAHMKKLNVGSQRLEMNDISITGETINIPRVAVIMGIDGKSPFSIYNSDRYKGKDRVYCVTHVGKDSVKMETTKKPVLKYSDMLEIPGVIGVVKANEFGVSLYVNKKYCRLCRVYVVMVSLNKPKEYISMARLVCTEGSTVYVYSKLIDNPNKVRYAEVSQRIVGWCVDYNEMINIIDRTVNNLTLQALPVVFIDKLVSDNNDTRIVQDWAYANGSRI